MKHFVKILNTLFIAVLLFFTACFGSETTIDEDYHPGVAVKSAANLEISDGTLRSVIDAGSAYDFGRTYLHTTSDVSFSIKNTGERTATITKSKNLGTEFNYKGGSFPGSGGTCALTIKEGTSCSIVMTFKPIKVESYSTTLILEYLEGHQTPIYLETSKKMVGEGYAVSPEITSLTPDVGSLAGGNTITIAGKYFFGTPTVTIGDNPCTQVTVVSSSRLTCMTAAHAAGGVDVVMTSEELLSKTLPGGFTYYAPAPTVTSVSPTAGALAGGTGITITGTGFLSGATVKVGGVTCTSPTLVSDTSLTCTTGAHAAGVTSVIVSNADFQTGTGANLYSYQAGPTVTTVNPTAGALAGGTVITITGTGFLTGATVTLGGVTCAPPAVVNSSTIMCTTGARIASNVNIKVTNSDTQYGLGGGL